MSGIYQRRPPERGAEGLKAPNIVAVVRCCYRSDGRFLEVSLVGLLALAGEVAIAALGGLAAEEPRRCLTRLPEAAIGDARWRCLELCLCLLQYHRNLPRQYVVLLLHHRDERQSTLRA
jgi:hypothetical protein